jgi:hypothetical protein
MVGVTQCLVFFVHGIRGTVAANYKGNGTRAETREEKIKGRREKRNKANRRKEKKREEKSRR